MTLLDIKHLTIKYPDRHGVITAVNNISLSVGRGEILGIVGESGAGKSTIGNAVIGLLQPPGYISNGSIHLNQERIDKLANDNMRILRGRKIAMIFQDPMTSLNPLETIESQLVETIILHLKLKSRMARERAINLLKEVGIPNPETRIKQFPHEFSGGMRQRVVIALALAGEPDLIFADEPTTALDVSIQAQILKLIKRLCHNKNVGLILVTHDIGVIAETADRVAVMYRGKLVEIGSTYQIIRSPSHPYTKALISAVPPSNRRIERFTRVNYINNPKTLKNFDLEKYWLGQSDQKVTSKGTILKIKKLNKVFYARNSLFAVKNNHTKAVKNVSFNVSCGETFGLVGESGSGKSTVARLITGIHKVTSGEIFFDDLNLCKNIKIQKDILKKRQIQMIFQDPYSSLNARMKVGQILIEPIILNRLTPNKAEAEQVVKDLLELVELDPDAARKYPHAFSGGQRQRISIARALASQPRFLICDEPTSALDVSIQAQILNLLKDLQERLKLTYLFISHDLPVMRQICDRIAVMRDGMIIEQNYTENIFKSPQHNYTQELISLMPKFER